MEKAYIAYKLWPRQRNGGNETDPQDPQDRQTNSLINLGLFALLSSDQIL